MSKNLVNIKRNIASENSYFLLSNKFTTIFFEIKDSIKKLKSKENVTVNFGINNNNFNATLTDNFFKKKELLKLFILLKKINNNHLICERVSFINPKLKFDFWTNNEEQFLDINFVFSNNTFDTYTLALDKEDIKKLYNILNLQIYTNK